VRSQCLYKAHAGKLTPSTRFIDIQETYSCLLSKIHFRPAAGIRLGTRDRNVRSLSRHALMACRGTDRRRRTDTACYIAPATGKNLRCLGSGSTNYVMDPGREFEPRFPVLTLPVHYRTPPTSDVADASGFRLCTGAPRATRPAFLVLGSTAFVPAHGTRKRRAVRHLSADGFMAITIISALPHMHRVGSGFRTGSTRSRGLS